MAITSVTDGNTANASDVNQYKQHLEGDAGKTLAWFLRQSSGDFTVLLSSADGSTKFVIQDSGGSEVASIDSDGNLTTAGLTPTTFTLPSSATPSQTTDAQIVWDSDDDVITVGTGAATKQFWPIPTGLIAMWHGTLASIPAGWVLCDGTNGTPDLREKFVRGSAAATDPGGTGGAASHSHTLVTTSGSNGIGGTSGIYTTSTNTQSNLPPYYDVAFIMKS